MAGNLGGSVYGSPYQTMSSGITPIPGSLAWDQMYRNTMAAQPTGAVSQIRDIQTQAQNQANQLYGPGGTLAGGGGLASSSSSSSSSSNPLMDEILAMIRRSSARSEAGGARKEFRASRARMQEDLGLAMQQQARSLAPRGLFRSGVGVEEMINQIMRPYSRAQADLESNLADVNAGLRQQEEDRFLRGADILSSIEAAQRQAQAQQMAARSQVGTGGITLPGGTFSGASTKVAGDGGSGIFGANFVNPTSPPPSAPPAGGGSTSPRPGTPPQYQPPPDDLVWNPDIGGYLTPNDPLWQSAGGSSWGGSIW
mgnify:CR=1 FL=1